MMQQQATQGFLDSSGAASLNYTNANLDTRFVDAHAPNTACPRNLSPGPLAAPERSNNMGQGPGEPCPSGMARGCFGNRNVNMPMVSHSGPGRSPGPNHFNNVGLVT